MLCENQQVAAGGGAHALETAETNRPDLLTYTQDVL